MSTAHKKYYVVSFDLETTGLSVTTDCICEFGFSIHLFDFECSPTGQFLNLEVHNLPAFHSYCRPSKKMHPGAARVTGLTDEFLSKQKAIKDVFIALETHMNAVMEDRKIPRILLSYNGKRFDFPILVNEASRCMVDVMQFIRTLRVTAFIDMLPFNRTRLDPAMLVRNHRGACSFKLGDVYQSLLKKKLDGAHGAMADSVAVVDIVKTSQCREKFFHLLVRLEDPNRIDTDEPSKQDDNVKSSGQCVFNLMAETREIMQAIKKGAAKGEKRRRTVCGMIENAKRHRGRKTSKGTL